MNFVPVILAGGAGTRLWPVSREGFPKPFITLPDGTSLLQRTAERAAALPGAARLLTVTNRDYYFHTREEYGTLKTSERVQLDYLLEPGRRNTAPAVTLAALYLADTLGPDVGVLVLPADHLINDLDSFRADIAHGLELAARGHLVTFGVRPMHPVTGYGYIEAGTVCDDRGAFNVTRFIEKPDEQRAAEYVASGRFLWNAGIFCGQAKVFLELVRQHAPEVYRAAQQCWQNTPRDVAPIMLDRDTFNAIPETSLDYAVLEKADRIAVVPGRFDWSDIGSWRELGELAPADAQGNRQRGEVLLFDSKNCYVHSEGRLVAALGVEGLVVVDTPDALLVADRTRVQDVNRIVECLRQMQHEAHLVHRTVYRPWGTYTVLERGEGFKIKRIVVKPGASLSLQLHHHRNEHWVVVSGTATVINGKEERLVQRNESTYIPAGTPHRLMNPGSADLVIIEVQSGDYVEEDDIVRLEDDYGRS